MSGNSNSGRRRSIPTAPEQDPRLPKLIEAIKNVGLPAEFAEILAEGYVARLRRRIFEQLTDKIGGGDELEIACGWKGPRRVLAKAMERAGYVIDIRGVLIVPDAITESPEYVKCRWRRQNIRSFNAARSRALAPLVKNPREESDGLFADTEGAPPLPPAREDAGHAEFVEYWHEQYRRVNGVEYPFVTRDFKIVSDILDSVEDVHQCKRIIDAYLANKTPFYSGHPLHKLHRDLPSFAASKGIEGSKNVAIKKRVDADRLERLFEFINSVPADKLAALRSTVLDNLPAPARKRAELLDPKTDERMAEAIRREWHLGQRRSA